MFIQFLASRLILPKRMSARLDYQKPACKFAKDQTETCHVFNFCSMGHYRKITIITVCTPTKEPCFRSSLFSTHKNISSSISIEMIVVRK